VPIAVKKLPVLTRSRHIRNSCRTKNNRDSDFKTHRVSCIEATDKNTTFWLHT